MLHVRCKNCNKELKLDSSKIKCCGCDNMTTISGDKISAVDLTKVELIKNYNKQEKKSFLSKEDMEFQESRRTRKVRKLDFEVR